MTSSVTPANESSSVDEVIEKILPGVHEAGNPYFDFIFGDANVARDVLARWMRRKSSEVSVDRAALLRAHQETAGGFIALTGAELNTCRRLDTAALTMTGNRERREGIVKRIEMTRDLFLPVEDRDFYLSKFWIDPRHRGAGHSRELMKQFLAAGQRAGCSRFRLDVCAENEQAIRIYQSFGFRGIAQRSVAGASLRYLAMAAERSSQ